MPVETKPLSRRMRKGEGRPRKYFPPNRDPGPDDSLAALPPDPKTSRRIPRELFIEAPNEETEKRGYVLASEIEIDKFIDALSTGGATVRIERKGPRELKYAYVVEMPVSQFKDGGIESLKRQYGGGEYMLFFFDADGQAYRPVALPIDPRAQGELDAQAGPRADSVNDTLKLLVQKLTEPRPVPAGDDKTMQMLALLQESNKTMMLVIAEAMKPRETVRPTTIGEIAAIVTAATPLLTEILRARNNSGGGQSIRDTLELLHSARELLPDAGNGADGQDTISKYLTLLAPILQPLLAGSGSSLHRPGPAIPQQQPQQPHPQFQQQPPQRLTAPMSSAQSPPLPQQGGQPVVSREFAPEMSPELKAPVATGPLAEEDRLKAGLQTPPFTQEEMLAALRTPTPTPGQMNILKTLIRSRCQAALPMLAAAAQGGSNPESYADVIGDTLEATPTLIPPAVEMLKAPDWKRQIFGGDELPEPAWFDELRQMLLEQFVQAEAERGPKDEYDARCRDGAAPVPSTPAIIIAPTPPANTIPQ